MIPTFIRGYEASAAMAGYRIVAFSDTASSKKVAQADDNDVAIIGVSDKLGGEIGDMVDVIRSGLGQVQLGGTVTAGAPLTADANGKAVAATAAAGETRRIVGFAEEPGVADDVIDAWIAPGLLHEPAGA